jgi:hypothetical protein
MGEVIALVKRRIVTLDGKCVGSAIPEVQPGSMSVFSIRGRADLRG